MKSALIALLCMLVPAAVSADDAPPTTQEIVGYALSLAGNASHGDKKALAFLQTNAAAKDYGAEFGLGEYYVLTKDYPQSVTWFQKSADQGFAGGYYALGVAYDSGQGVPQDYAQAMRLYLKATELPTAEMNIGLLYAHGHGVKQDYSQAASWYRKAADAGSVEADLALGSMYQMGSGVKQDDAQAMQWYSKAADMGDALAEYRLGLIYERSRSLQDYKQSVYWYQKATDQGVADAQLNLGILYSSGKGIPADAARALQLFQMAANQGNGHAQYDLANSFATGAGTRPDPGRAYEWMTIAKASLDGKDPTYAMASGKLEDLEKQLSPAQVSRAKGAAAEWLKSHSTTSQ
jgi:TPR repeat protein